MWTRAVWFTAACALVACRSGPSLEDHLRREAAFLALGVDPAREVVRVRESLAQRGLRVVRERRGSYHRALEAVGGVQSAVRVITARGVQLAEDASEEDLFEPGRVALLDVGRAGEPELVGVTRVALGDDLGCARVFQVTPAGAVLPQPVEVASFGDQACVAALRRQGAALEVTVGWPALGAGVVPRLRVPYRFAPARLGQRAPQIRPARPVAERGWAAEQARAPACEGGFPQRQAAGVARAALRSAAGEGVQAQLSAYSRCLGPTAADQPALVAETRAHIGRGWLAPGVLEEAPGGQEEEGADPGGAAGVPKQQGAEAL